MHYIKHTCFTYRVEVFLQEMPVWFYHLKHHVVEEVLYKVEHALTQCERRRVPVTGAKGVLLR